MKWNIIREDLYRIVLIEICKIVLGFKDVK